MHHVEGGHVLCYLGLFLYSGVQHILYYMNHVEGGHVLCYLGLFLYSGVQHILYCVFVLFRFSLSCCQFLWIILF
jgi:hypothetical protein